MTAYRLIALLVVLVVCSLVGFAPAPLPRRDRERIDPTDVNGTWVFELWEHNGSASASGKQYTIEMTKEKYDFVSVGGGGRTHYEMTLDPTRRPYAFEWRMSGRVSYLGSYRLEGDKMTMIFVTGSDPAKRPTDFNGTPEFRFIMRRTKRN